MDLTEARAFPIRKCSVSLRIEQFFQSLRIASRFTLDRNCSSKRIIRTILNAVTEGVELGWFVCRSRVETCDYFAFPSNFSAVLMDPILKLGRLQLRGP